MHRLLERETNESTDTMFIFICVLVGKSFRYSQDRELTKANSSYFELVLEVYSRCRNDPGNFMS